MADINKFINCDSINPNPDEEFTAYDFCLEKYQTGDKAEPLWGRYALWNGELKELVEISVGDKKDADLVQCSYKLSDFTWYEVTYKKFQLLPNLFEDVEKYVKQGSHWITVTGCTVKRVIPASEIKAIRAEEDYNKEKKVELANLVWKRSDLEDC